MTYIGQFAKNNNYTYTLAIFDIAKVSSNVVVVQIFSMSQKFRYQVFFFMSWLWCQFGQIFLIWIKQTNKPTV